MKKYEFFILLSRRGTVVGHVTIAFIVFKRLSRCPRLFLFLTPKFGFDFAGLLLRVQIIVLKMQHDSKLILLAGKRINEKAFYNDVMFTYR